VVAFTFFGRTISKGIPSSVNTSSQIAQSRPILPAPFHFSAPAMPNYLPVDLWQQYASPVWMDIDYGDTLNKQEAREEKDEKHICPLQLPTIARAIHLWTNEGDTVLDNCIGSGTTAIAAENTGRRWIGIERDVGYFGKACERIAARVNAA